MKKQRTALIVGIMVLSIIIAPSVFAQSTQDLKEMIEKQNAMIEKLQNEVNALKTGQTDTGGEELQDMVRTEVESQLEETTSDFDSQIGDLWSNLRRVQVHGFVSQGFLYSLENNYLLTDSKNGEFEFNEMAINFSANLTDDLSLGLQLFSRDQGIVGNNGIVLDWAYADYRFRDWMGLRAGIMKIPHGLYNETRDIDMARTSIFLPQGIYEENFREVRVSMMGLGAYGEVPLGEAGSLSYNVMGGSQAFDDDSSGYTALWTSYGDANNYSSEAGFTSAGQLIWNTPLDGLRFAGSYYFANELSWYGNAISGTYAQLFEIPIGDPWGITFTDWIDIIASAEYVWENLTLAAEYRTFEADSETTGFGFFEREKEGYYFNANYRFTDWFELGGYYSYYEAEFGAVEHDYTLSARFDINDSWIAKLEAHKISGTNNSLDGFGTQKEDEWWLFAAKLTYSF